MAKQNVAAVDSPFASMLPDEMVSGGLADDFDGIIREARVAKFDYDGSIDEPVLAFRAKIERLDPGLEPEEKFITQYWSMGSLDHFKPSMDGKETADEGIYALRVGTRTALNNNTNYAQLLRSIIDAQFPRDKFSPAVTFLEGVKGHFNRLPPDKKGGQFKNQTEEQAKKASKRDILCLTRFDGFETGAVASKPNGQAGTPTSAPAAGGAASSNDLDAQLHEIVVAITKGKPAMRKTALSGEVLKKMKGNPAANKAVKRVVEKDFLESLAEVSVLFNEEDGTVEYMGE